MVTLRLLAGLGLDGPSGPVTGPAGQRKRLALLALLALAPEGRLSRDKAIAYLWPKSDSERARHQLSSALYEIRKAAGEDAIFAVGDELRLNADAVRTDVAEFEAALAAGDTARAVSLYRGPLLDGFFLSDAPEFERWVDGEREQLAGGYARALEALAEAAEEQHDGPAAVEWWRARAAHDPYDSRVALRLMRALDAVGNRAGALTHARIYTTLLREEFDAEPDADVIAFADRLRLEPQPAAAPAVPVSSAPGSPEPAPPAVLPPASAGDVPERTPAALPPASVSRRRHAAPIIGGLVLVIIAAIAVPYGALRLKGPAPARSVGVLPFVNMSPDPANTYFSDGLSEQIIMALSRIGGLQVAARTSSFALRNRELGVRAIGDTLGVQAVLEGSVLVDGDRLRVIAQLIDARTGYQVWSARYDGELRDAFALQDRVAGAIADALHLQLTGSTAPVATATAPGLEAYDLYLRGLYLRNSLSAEALRQASEYFDRAIELEPDFAAVWAAKASVVAPQAYFRYAGRDAVAAELRTLTERALQLDPQLGEAHVALGILRLFFDWDWSGAEEALLRAIELNPNDAHAWHHLANYYAATGSIQNALAARQRSLQLDPLNARTLTVISRDYFIVGDYEGALRESLRAARLDPVHPLQLGLGPGLPTSAADVYIRLGRTDEAIEHYLRIATLRGATHTEVDAMREAYATAGVTAFWKQWLAMDVRQSGASPDPVRMAVTHVVAGDTARAIDWLEHALAERNPGLIYLRRDPFLAPLRAHPRFLRIAAEMNLPDVPVNGTTPRSAR